MRLAYASPRDRVLAIRSADPIKCSMCSAHVSTRLMPGKCNLFGACAHRVSKKLHLLDRTLQAHFTQTKTNELEPNIKSNVGEADSMCSW